jgi:hypothetical protein
MIDVDRAFRMIEVDANEERLFVRFDDEARLTDAECLATEQDGGVCTTDTRLVLESSGQRRLTGKLPNGKTFFDVMLSGDSLLPVKEEERVTCVPAI